MKLSSILFLFATIFFVANEGYGQTYNMSNSTVTTCSGTFYDPGGAGGNYGNNNLFTMTFCSGSTANIQLDFTVFDLENNFDDIFIYDGNSTGAPLIGTWTGTNSPGTVTSTGSCITILFDSDGSVTDIGWAANISCITPTCTDGIMNGQETGVDCGGPTCPACPDCFNGIQDGNETGVDCGGACAPCPTPCQVDASVTVVGPPIDCNGGTVDLDANGVGAFEYVLYNNFDNGSAGSGWNSTGGAAFGQPCGPNPTGTNYYWASTSTGTPQLTTVGFDVSCGGVLSFDMAYSTQGGPSPCEGPDLPNEGVTLQYSTDNGATWNVIQYWDPNGGYDPQLTNWNTYTFPIPPGAQTTNTIFQWIQTNSSGTCCDNWGIDNVSITSILDCTPYWYDWDMIPGSPDNAQQTQNPTTTSTYIVTYTNGNDACYDTVTVVVPPGTTADAGPDLVYCAGSGNVVIGADPVTPDDGATYTWDNGAGSGTIDLGGGTDNGQGTVSPGATTTYTLSVTYNGCTETDDVVVTVDQAPTASNPPNINVQCAGDVPAPDPLVVTDEADDITVPPSVTFISDVSDNNTCPETITRTYRVEDGCGNFVDVQQLIIIEDTQAPVLDPSPANVAVQCAADVPAMVNLGWTDNCDGAGTVTGADVSDGQTCPETITRTWTYTDACGNTATETQTITVHDTQAPVLVAPPANVTVECAGDVPAMTDLGWTDNCDGSGTVTGADVSDGQTCPETITRTWTYTDACGNNATVSQTIIVDDTTPPTASNPAPIIISGGTPVPNPDPLVVTDEADNCTVNPVVAWVNDVSDNGNCPEIITRTYSVTDECGNQITVTQIIEVGDAVPPTASNPAPINVQCAADVPAPDPLVVTDEADNGAPPVVTFESDTSDGQSCPETITRTYRVTDDCGNFIFVTQTITIHDTQAPVFNAPPADVTVECIGDVPAMTNLGWTDNCDGSGNVTGSDVSDGQSCPETITRTWTYTDACGNTATETQIITVHDTQAPVFAAAPADASYQCIGDVPAMTGLGWTDNCDGSGTVAGTEVSDGQTCPETIIRTWTYTDACGNTSTETQTITVHDTQAPVLAAAPADASYQCIGDVPAMTGLGWTDNCDGSGTVAGTEVSDGQTCPETITRTWTYTDACGNTATETQTITVHDTQAPVLAPPPANVTVECAGDVPAMTDLGWTDNCDGAGTVTGADVSDGQTCPETITRTWTYTDACGNNATVSQTIIVDDTTPPTASNPATTVVPGGPAPPVDVTVVNDEADNCTVNPTVTFVSETSDNNPCPETITRIYEITDDCGNTTQVTHLIQITDPIMPTGTAPADITVECIGDVPAADPLLITDEADNQGVPTVAHVGDVSNGQTCPETITRTYSITDVCGNQITVDQIITVNDITAPVMAAAPADVTVECIGDVPAMTDLGWTDNCDGAGTVTGVDVSDGQSCPETITRTWTYTDACGNTSSTSQTIIVDDTTPPTATAPGTVNVECIGDVPAADINSVTNVNDNCTVAPVVAFVGDVSDGQSCPETITRT
ncbi:MAG: CUB domain-containing protein [Fluviicola sp.]